MIFSTYTMSHEDAVALAESGVWRDWSMEQRAQFQLYTYLLCMPFNKFHEAMEKTLGRSIWTHEFASPDLLKEEMAGKRRPPTMKEIVELIPPDKHIVVVEHKP